MSFCRTYYGHILSLDSKIRNVRVLLVDNERRNPLDASTRAITKRRGKLGKISGYKSGNLELKYGTCQGKVGQKRPNCIINQ